MISEKDNERAERLFAILGEIDPEMSAGDVSESKRISRKTVWGAVLGIAAALALIAGIYNLRRPQGLEITPTAPTADSAPIVTATPPVSEPIVSQTDVSESTKPDDNATPEPPGGDGIGGDERAEFNCPVKRKFEGIDMSLRALRKDVDLEEWLDTLPSDDENGLRPDESFNIYSFIKAFGITKEEAEKVYEPILDPSDDQRISLQDLEVFFSGDEEAIARALANDYTIVVGDRMYTLYWLYRHSIEDYIAAGITPEEIKKRESLYDGWFYYPEDGWLYYFSPEDGWSYYFNESRIEEEKAFYAKLKSYVPDIKFERLEMYEAYCDIAVNANGVDYNVFWLSSHTIQDFRELGITVDDLKIVMEKMAPYGMTNEYDWIDSCYRRMIDDMAGAGMPENHTEETQMPEDSMEDCIDGAVDEIIE